MSTIIISGILLGAVVTVIYRRFFRKHSSGCADCVETGCPLIDPQSIVNPGTSKLK